jgi:hypothetical protein
MSHWCRVWVGQPARAERQLNHHPTPYRCHTAHRQPRKRTGSYQPGKQPDRMRPLADITKLSLAVGQSRKPALDDRLHLTALSFAVFPPPLDCGSRYNEHRDKADCPDRKPPIAVRDQIERRPQPGDTGDPERRGRSWLRHSNRSHTSLDEHRATPANHHLMPFTIGEADARERPVRKRPLADFYAVGF